METRCADPSVLLELAGRVEALTGADREVDYLVALAIGWAPPGIDPRLFEGESTCLLYKGLTPAFTGSVDAAMRLVPDGSNWRVDYQQKPIDRTPQCLGMVWRELGSGKLAHASTPAPALTAACLRALAAREG